jgi:hypothetical protein
MKGKIPSGNEINLVLKPLPKLIGEVLSRYNALIIAFKLGKNQKAQGRKMLGQGVSMVLVNTPESMGGSRGDYVLLTRHREIRLSGEKEMIAKAIWDAVNEGF